MTWTLLTIVSTALLSSAFTLGLAYLLFERRYKERLEKEIDRHVDEALEKVGKEVEQRVRKGVLDAVAAIPSSEVIAGATRTAARSGVDLVGTLLGAGRRREGS